MSLTYIKNKNISRVLGKPLTVLKKSKSKAFDTLSIVSQLLPVNNSVGLNINPLLFMTKLELIKKQGNALPQTIKLNVS